MSTKYISSLVSILVFVLPLLGIELGTEQLTTTVQTIAAIGAGIYVMFRGWSKGETNAFGFRK